MTHRTETLADRHPHAAELLGCYRSVVDAQEKVGSKAARAAGSLENVLEAAEGAEPRLAVTRLPATELVSSLRDFVETLAASVPDPLAATGELLLAAEDPDLAAMIEALLAAEDFSRLASKLECEATHLVFYARAFLQPVVSELAGVAGIDRETEGAGPEGNRCPVCGHPPTAALLADEDGALGRKRLVCSLCAHAWPFGRGRCPECGETDSDRLAIHADDSRPHLRLEACESCGTYHKVIDRRKDGAADPVMDDIVSIDLDLWAIERGSRRAFPRPFGL